MLADIFIKSKRNNSRNKILYEYTIKESHFVKSFFNIHNIQDAVNFDKDLNDKSYIHDFYLIIWFEKGKGKHIIDFKEYEVQDGTVFFISPGQIHQFKEIICYKGYSIIFSEDFLYNLNEKMYRYVKNKIFGSFNNTSICYINKNNLLEDIQRQFCLVLDEYKNGNQLFGHHDKLALLLSNLIIFLKRHAIWNNQFENENIDNNYYYYLSFIDYVEVHFKQIHKVKEYAKALNLSVGTLNRSIIKISGKRPMKIINERIVLEAKRILNYSVELRIKQVSEILGFTEVSNFVKFFKHNVGMTPNDFRELSY